MMHRAPNGRFLAFAFVMALGATQWRWPCYH
jgi:hypothetical protein